MKYVLLLVNTVIETASEQYPVAKPLRWIEVTDDVDPTRGYVYNPDDGLFSPPTDPVTPDDVFRRAVKTLLKALMQYIKGDITKAQLADVYLTVKDVIEVIYGSSK